MIGIQVGIIIGWFFRGSTNEAAQQKTIQLQADTAAKAQAALAPVIEKVVPTTPPTTPPTPPVTGG